MNKPKDINWAVREICDAYMQTPIHGIPHLLDILSEFRAYELKQQTPSRHKRGRKKG